MKTAHDLLITAPDSQVTRARLIYKAIAKGDWADAVHHLKNAIQEEGNSPWGLDACDLHGQCVMHATKPRKYRKPLYPLGVFRRQWGFIYGHNVSPLWRCKSEVAGQFIRH